MGAEGEGFLSFQINFVTYIFPFLLNSLTNNCKVGAASTNKGLFIGDCSSTYKFPDYKERKSLRLYGNLILFIAHSFMNRF